MVIAGNHEDDGANFTNYQKRFLVPDNGFQDNQFYRREFHNFGQVLKILTREVPA